MISISISPIPFKRISWTTETNKNFHEKTHALIAARNALAGIEKETLFSSSISPMPVGEFILKTQDNSNSDFYKFNQSSYSSYMRFGYFSCEFHAMLSYSLFLNIIAHEGFEYIDPLFDQTGILNFDEFKVSLANRLILDFFKTSEINSILKRINQSSLTKNIFFDRGKKEISILFDKSDSKEIFKINRETKIKQISWTDKPFNEMKFILTPDQIYQTKQWHKLISYLKKTATKEDLKKYEFENHIQFGHADVVFDHFSALDHRSKQEQDLWKETKNFVLTLINLAVANACSQLKEPSWIEVEKTKHQIQSLLENQNFLLASLDFIVERRKFIATNVMRDFYSIIPSDSVIEYLATRIRSQFPSQKLD
jgi:hypothetical protein